MNKPAPPHSSLDQQIAFYIPSKRKDDTELGVLIRAQAIHAIMNFLLTELGGATMTEGRGYFADRSGKIHSENTTICLSYFEKSKMKDWFFKEIELMANSLAIELEQDSIAVSINEKLHNYSPTISYRKKYPQLVSEKTFGFRKYLETNLKQSCQPTP